MIFKNRKLAHKTVYLSTYYGKRSYYFDTKTFSIKRPGFKNNIDLLKQNIEIEIMKHRQDKEFIYDVKPLDEQQLRVILTHDKLLGIANPKIYNNFEVHAYSTNQKALDEFHREVDAIVEQIKADYLADQK
jgi:hypothetical protein